MSKARDIANILSANTAIATDTEVTAALSTAVTNERTASATLTNKTIDGNSNTVCGFYKEMLIKYLESYLNFGGVIFL